MRLPALLSALFLMLAGCGADAPPIAPESPDKKDPETGITLSGDARIGVVSSF